MEGDICWRCWVSPRGSGHCCSHLLLWNKQTVTHYFKKNEYQGGESCNPLAPELNAYGDLQRGTQWCTWLGHYTTNRKVVDSIPDGVNRNFSLT